MGSNSQKGHSSNHSWERADAGARVHLRRTGLRDRGRRAEGSVWRFIRASHWGSI